MAKVWVKPTGSIIKGHVLDCAVGPLQRALREHDAQLYVKWNPRKLHGWGCWEVRRKPELKTIKYTDVVTFKGMTIAEPKYNELSIVNHVMDVPFLNYSVVSKVKAMDTWTKEQFGYKGKNFAKEAEYLEAKYDEKIDEESMKERDYNLKQLKSEIRDLKEFILSGGNPAQIADFWK